MTTPVDREIARVQHDLAVEHRRKRLNLAYCAKLQARIDELRAEQDKAEIEAAFVAVVEEQRRMEANP